MPIGNGLRSRWAMTGLAALAWCACAHALPVCPANAGGGGEVVAKAADGAKPPVCRGSGGELLAGNDVFVLDVRRADEFALAHVPGAMNMAPAAALRKEELRQRRLVLFGSGRDDHALQDLCADMKRAGFRSVDYFRGGMIGAIDKAIRLSGSGISDGQLRGISAFELAVLSRRNDYVVAFSPEAAGVGASIRQAVALEALQRRILAPKSPKETLLGVVVISNAPPSPDQRQAIQSLVGEVPVLWAANDPESLSKLELLQRRGDVQTAKGSQSGCNN